ncbi:MAG: hypothetical protein ACC642_00010 [Pseudomonadales bacterium]
MDRAYLDRVAARWLHRTDITEDDVNDSILAVTEVLAAMLRVSANETTEVIAHVVGVPDPLAGYVEMRMVEAAQVGGPKPLESASLEAVRQWSSIRVPPSIYAVWERKLYVGPDVDQEVTAYYWVNPGPIGTDTTDTNPVLTEHPSLYRDGLLQQLAMLAQDFELAQAYGDRMAGNLSELNAQAERSRQGGPQRMRAM